MRGFLVLLTICSVARAAVESEQVQAGVQAYEDLEYQKAIDLLQKALAETLTKEEKIVTYKTLAFSHVALGRPEPAREAFLKLLRIDPGFELDRRISPRVRSVFEEARTLYATGRGGAAPEGMPAVQAQVSPKAPKEGQAVTVSLTYPGGVAEKMLLFHRVRGQAAYSRVQVSGADGRFGVMLPGLQVKAPGLEYYVVLLDENGASVAQSGSLGQPLQLDVAALPKPVYKRGWFWGVIGGVVAAGAIVGGVVAGVTASNIGPNTPATLTIQPR